MVSLHPRGFLHLYFGTGGGDDDDLAVLCRPTFGPSVIFHVVERDCLVVAGDRVRRTVVVLISAIVKL